MHEEHLEKSNTGLILPEVIVLILIALLFSKCHYTGANAEMKEGNPEHTEAALEAPTGSVDSLGNFIYDEGEMIAIELPTDTLNVGKFSTEYKLYTFLADSTATLDTTNGNWFDFTNVRFKTGSSVMTDSSVNQLKNLVSIIKAFPNSKFKIGGYTDNTGDSTTNVALSQKRADAVSASIKTLGVANTQLTGSEGYGPLHPVGDNTTTEGKAMNRRVSVNVKAK
ncbi:OmpA family protein [Rhizosphaericola mali]|uniref:OmpA family protein n=1 Tax=Rhizosphaericola mali TaxID=2545455 RepID=A0A5P2G0E4_9BACT|nr:OmpA family protein [Rhizosphaericola mali]QES89274.1 OmpA family protein [Rhizosphaericola mali]